MQMGSYENFTIRIERIILHQLSNKHISITTSNINVQKVFGYNKHNLIQYKFYQLKEKWILQHL